MSRGATCADQSHEVLIPLYEDDEKNANDDRLADDTSVFRMTLVFKDQGQRIRKDRYRPFERNPMFPCVPVGFAPIPRESHDISVIHFMPNVIF
jgi:hypothetical protein